MTITKTDTQPRITRTRLRPRLQDIAYAKARRRKKAAAAVEAAPEPASTAPEQVAVAARPKAAPDSVLTDLPPAPHAGRVTKNDLVLQQLQTGAGASIPDLMEATGWQAHSVRGFLSAVVRKKRGMNLVSDIGADGERRYRIDSSAAVA